ncbi:MAG: energy transducer TonB [Deltaproteobacteria bacterium]|nr:energy transducer TonB [Deltaproteobacteria bacterium]
MTTRTAGKGLTVLAGAAAVNLALFGLLPLLLSRTPPPRPLAPLSLAVFLPPEEAPTPPPVEPPPPARPAPPRPAEQAARSAAASPLAPPSPPQMSLPPLDLSLSPRLDLGPAVPALPPGPRAPAAPGVLDRPPLLLHRAPPPYPFDARRRRLEGWVRVRFLVDREGRVGRVELLEARPPGVFEETVLRTLPTWRFEPALAQGRPREEWVETRVSFQLARP